MRVILVNELCVLSTTHYLPQMKQTNSDSNFGMTLGGNRFQHDSFPKILWQEKDSDTFFFQVMCLVPWSGWFGLVVGHLLGAISQQQQDLPWNLGQRFACYMLKLILILLKEASLIKHEVKLEASVYGSLLLPSLFCGVDVPTERHLRMPGAA